MVLLLIVQQPERRHRREDRVTVVRGATPVELVALPDGAPGVEPLAPDTALGLLVVVSIEEDGLAPLARQLQQDHRGQVLPGDDVNPKPRDTLPAAPVRNQAGGLLVVTARTPARVECKRPARNLDVARERRDDVGLPDSVGQGEGGLWGERFAGGHGGLLRRGDPPRSRRASYPWGWDSARAARGGRGVSGVKGHRIG